jgi:hypothetical protein
MTDLAGARWRKSRRSNNQGACVEVADNLADLVGVRDSKDPGGPVLAFGLDAWRSFVDLVKADY